MKRRTLLTALLLPLGWTACAPSDRQAPREAPDPRALMEADRAFARDVAERGLDAWVEYFAEDGTMLIPGREVRGRAAIREVTAPLFATPGNSLTWDPTRAEIAASGEVGYTIGRYRREVRGAAGPRIEEGSYVTVWRLQPDGSWRVELDLGVPDPEPDPPQE